MLWLILDIADDRSIPGGAGLKKYTRPLIFTSKNLFTCKNRGQRVNFSSCSSNGQVIFSVSIDINYSEQKFAKVTFKPMLSEFALICVVFR